MALAVCIKWLKTHKDPPTEKRDAQLKKCLGELADMEEGHALFCIYNSLTMSKELLYLSTMPKVELEGVLAFLAPASQPTAQQGTLALVQECFWWPMMIEECKALV